MKTEIAAAETVCAKVLQRARCSGSCEHAFDRKALGQLQNTLIELALALEVTMRELSRYEDDGK